MFVSLQVKMIFFFSPVPQACSRSGEEEQPDGSLPVGGFGQLGLQNLPRDWPGEGGGGGHHDPPQTGVRGE